MNVFLWFSYVVMMALYAYGFGSYGAALLPVGSKFSHQLTNPLKLRGVDGYRPEPLDKRTEREYKSLGEGWRFGGIESEETLRASPPESGRLSRRGFIRSHAFPVPGSY